VISVEKGGTLLALRRDQRRKTLGLLEEEERQGKWWEKWEGFMADEWLGITRRVKVSRSNSGECKGLKFPYTYT